MSKNMYSLADIFDKRRNDTIAEYRLKQVTNKLDEFVNGMWGARILIAFGLWVFFGVYIALTAMIAFEIARQASMFLIKKAQKECNSDASSCNRIENYLTLIPIMNAINMGWIVYLLAMDGRESAYDSGVVLVFANMCAQIFQNSFSLKHVFTATMLGAATVIAMVLQHSIVRGDITGAAAPSIFVIFLVGVSFVAYRDRFRAMEARKSLEQNNQHMREIMEEQEKETNIRMQAERLAKVGRFQWLFPGEKYWSSGAYSAFGVDESFPPLSNTDFLARIVPEDRDLYRENLMRARQNHSGFEFGFNILSDHGEVKSVYCYGTPITEGGNHVGFEGIVVDQTHTAEMLSSLQNAQELLNVALINGRAVVLERDMKSGKMRAYGAVDIFDVDKQCVDEELEAQVMRCLGRRDTHIVFGVMGRAETSGKIETAEHRVAHADGKQLHVRVAMGVEGSLKLGEGRMISITTDISDEVARRDELAMALKEAQRASRVKSEFLANMSHEIRTPLNGVIAVAGLLAKTELGTNQREMVGMIESSGEALSHIINDVLDLARVESGRLEIEKIEFNLQDAVNSVTSLFGVKADEKGLNFNIEIDTNIDKPIIGDPIRIRQIIGNLISNAIKFTSSGSVTLKIESEKLDPLSNMNKYSFRVIDTGIGLSKDAVSRLFERFEQADGSITRKHGGSGLGLSISRALARLMGGDIYVSSIEGRGSEFRLEISLPCAGICGDCSYACAYSKNASANVQLIGKIEPATQVETEAEEIVIAILAADDNPTNRRVLEMLLTPMGIDLTLCENGAEAVAIFKQKRFDLVLMDIQMPVMDGLTATREIRKYEAKINAHTPIIALSANAMSHHVEEALEAGVDMHIAKPYTPQALLDGIERALETNEDLQSQVA